MISFMRQIIMVKKKFVEMKDEMKEDLCKSCIPANPKKRQAVD